VYSSYSSQLERILACLDLEMSETLLLHGPVGTYYAESDQSSYQCVSLLVDRTCLFVQVVARRLEGSTTAEVDGLASVEVDSWGQVAVAVDDTRLVVAATAVDSPELEAAATLDASLGAAHCKALEAPSGADEDLPVSGDQGRDDEVMKTKTKKKTSLAGGGAACDNLSVLCGLADLYFRFDVSSHPSYHLCAAH